MQISKESAQKIIDQFFAVVPKVKEFLDKIGKYGVSHGYIVTDPYYIRIRWFPKLDVNNFKSVGEVERASKNSVPQGTNASLLKQMLINLQQIIDDNNYPVKIILSIHDEIICEVKEEFAEQWLEIQKQTMIDTAKIIIKSIPVEVSGCIADYWKK